MKAMYSVYDRNGDCFDFCDDEETEHSLDYEAEHDRLRVWQWSAERQSCGIKIIKVKKDRAINALH
jgi:hypothetical protein